VTVAVETPQKLDSRQEALLRELAELRGEQQADDGSVQMRRGSFLDRLRGKFNH
jgi:molecular chaperone DnaJ